MLLRFHVRKQWALDYAPGRLKIQVLPLGTNPAQGRMGLSAALRGITNPPLSDWFMS
jgi:hypothetical protein